jgi:acetylornithine deacetylase/succinyl-diaminopimelate desuccinylase-like protein
VNDSAPAITDAPENLGAGAVELLRELIRINTVNPPGNEGPAQEMLTDLLSTAGFECRILAREPSRPNLVARLPGKAEGPTLALICHVDTVPADAEEWTHDPWSGDLTDGYVWGRGALDMKDQVAEEAFACAELASAGWRPERGDLLFICAADEETGAEYGAKWLCEEQPDAVRCDYVVNEGAGIALDFEGRRYFTLAIGEKGVFRFNLRTRGVAGHASLPNVGDNALLKLAPYIERLRNQPDHEATPDTRAFLERLLGDSVTGGPAVLEAALGRIHSNDPLLGALLAEPMLGVTLTPTKAHASDKDNVVPSKAEVLVDCRVPPAMDEAEVRQRIESVLGPEEGYEVDFVERIVGNRSDFTGPLAEAIEAWVSDVEPGAQVLPMVMPGFSDSHWFRKAFGAMVFGFCPQSKMTLAEATPLVHGADERVAVEDVDLAARFFWELPQRVLG